MNDILCVLILHFMRVKENYFIIYLLLTSGLGTVPLLAKNCTGTGHCTGGHWHCTGQNRHALGSDKKTGFDQNILFFD